MHPRTVFPPVHFEYAQQACATFQDHFFFSACRQAVMDAHASDSDGLVVAGATSAPTPIRSRARCAAAVGTIGTCVAWLVVDSEMLCGAELVSLSAADVAIPGLAASGLFVLLLSRRPAPRLNFVWILKVGAPNVLFDFYYIFRGGFLFFPISFLRMRRMLLRMRRILFCYLFPFRYLLRMRRVRGELLVLRKMAAVF
jgi:hypothetical protein